MNSIASDVLDIVREEEIEAATVRHRLLNPEVEMDLNSLAQNWFEVEVTLTVEGWGKAMSDPGLPGRIRGAFGAELLSAASPAARKGDACTWVPPCAFEVLFRKQGRMEPGFDFPSPWVIEVDAYRGNLLVRLRLFGFASEYVGAASEALAKALVCRLKQGNQRHCFLPKPQIIDRHIESVAGLQAEISSDLLRLDFLSPVLLSKKNVVHSPRSLITTVAVRLAGLARWHDAKLAMPNELIVEVSHRLNFEWFGAYDVKWIRQSNRQNKKLNMAGTIGQLEISGLARDVELVGLLLQFGNRFHIGADAAYGCGRFDLHL
nr:CRISPR system precrRNA processing endoribonuclease RAMP protein Cas6 [uncultured Cohaesibacter sp.]